jgi:hypothetical protein
MNCPVTDKLKANCPLFTVDKPDGGKRCIADMKRGGQNACVGKDPVYLTPNETILPLLYPGGFSAVADSTKHFHNFRTRDNEQCYLGCVHPITGAKLVWYGLPMGAGNSPAIACRINNGAVRQMKENHSVFQGKVVLNTWGEALSSGNYDERLGHGRMLMGEDGLPAAIVFSMVDDYFIHGPTLKKCGEAFSTFMDTAIRLGLICQSHKTKPPSRVQKFCGMMMDTTEVPRIVICTESGFKRDSIPSIGVGTRGAPSVPRRCHPL